MFPRAEADRDPVWCLIAASPPLLDGIGGRYVALLAVAKPAWRACRAASTRPSRARRGPRPVGLRPRALLPMILPPAERWSFGTHVSAPLGSGRALNVRAAASLRRLAAFVLAVPADQPDVQVLSAANASYLGGSHSWLSPSTEAGAMISRYGFDDPARDPQRFLRELTEVEVGAAVDLDEGPK
jgi:hypothetical protein